MPPDLSLPAHAPKLGQYSAYNWDDAAFALYNLTSDGKTPLKDVASTLEAQWLKQGNETHLVRPPTTPQRFKTLRDVVQAHIALDKIKKTRREDGGGSAAAGDLEWWPTAFIVLVRGEEWETRPGGLLFVFADDEKGCEMDKFFFKLEDAYMMLSSLSFGDEDLARSKEIYEQEPRD